MTISTTTITAINCPLGTTGTDFADYIVKATGNEITWKDAVIGGEIMTFVEIENSAALNRPVNGQGMSLALALDDMLEGLKDGREFTVITAAGDKMKFIVKW